MGGSIPEVEENVNTDHVRFRKLKRRDPPTKYTVAMVMLEVTERRNFGVRKKESGDGYE